MIFSSNDVRSCARSLSIWVLFMLQLLLYKRFRDDIFHFASFGRVPNEINSQFSIVIGPIDYEL